MDKEGNHKEVIVHNTEANVVIEVTCQRLFVLEVSIQVQSHGSSIPRHCDVIPHVQVGLE